MVRISRNFVPLLSRILAPVLTASSLAFGGGALLRTLGAETVWFYLFGGLLTIVCIYRVLGSLLGPAEYGFPEESLSAPSQEEKRLLQAEMRAELELYKDRAIQHHLSLLWWTFRLSLVAVFFVAALVGLGLVGLLTGLNVLNKLEAVALVVGLFIAFGGLEAITARRRSARRR